MSFFCGNVTTLDLFASSTWSRLHPVHHAHYVDVSAEDGIIFVEMLPRLTYSPRPHGLVYIQYIMHIMWTLLLKTVLFLWKCYHAWLIRLAHMVSSTSSTSFLTSCTLCGRTLAAEDDVIFFNRNVTRPDLFACMYDPHGQVCILKTTACLHDLMYILWTLLFIRLCYFLYILFSKRYQAWLVRLHVWSTWSGLHPEDYSMSDLIHILWTLLFIRRCYFFTFCFRNVTMLDLFACMCDPHGLVCILYIISAHYGDVTAEDYVGVIVKLFCFLVGMEGGDSLSRLHIWSTWSPVHYFWPHRHSVDVAAEEDVVNNVARLDLFTCVWSTYR